jgi:prolyl oligopeptidase
MGVMATKADPFEHLEDVNDPRTIAWTLAQNARTRTTLDALPRRAALVRRFAELLEIGMLGVPVERGGREFYTSRRGRQDQAVLYVREGGIDRILVDPVALDPSGLTALDWWYPSAGGRYVAYGLSRNGDERSTLYLLDVERASPFGETIPYTRYCALAWLPDESGFYYTRYPAASDYEQCVYRHVLGAHWTDDELVFGAGRPAEELFIPRLSSDGRFLAVLAVRGWVSNDIYLADRTASEPHRFMPVVESTAAIYDGFWQGHALVVRTNDDAPHYRCVAIDALDPAREGWRELVPEQRAAKLEMLAPARGGIVLVYLHDVMSVVHCLRDDGTSTLRAGDDFGGLKLGESVVGVTARDDSPIVYLGTVGFLQGPAVSSLRFENGSIEVEQWDAIDAPFDPSDYAVRQHWYASSDGTRVPMFVLARASTKVDGTAPAVLYGYGGFNISMTPTFQPALVPWLDAGGVFAIANLRGGGEFGEDWHRAGMREHKQNVFNDYFAAAEFLASSKIADPRRIGILGGSNGGLLVAATLAQRPELVAAAVCAVPLTDMLRYHRFLIARLWMNEYGNPDDPADAEFLRAYSPYHNIRDGVAYPASFIVTAESDTRVDPSHARKFGARLQSATSGDAPTLIYIEPHAGHGVGKPRAKQIEELADRWSFLMKWLMPSSF